MIPDFKTFSPRNRIPDSLPRILQGTRRRLILDTIKRYEADFGNHPAASELADAIESALLQTTINAEECESDALHATRVVRETLDSEQEYAGRPSATVTPDNDETYEAQLLEQREEARAGEGHWKAQRDAAFRLLQWVLPDLMGHPSDTLGADLADDAPDEDCEDAPGAPDNFGLSEQARTALAARIEEGRIDPNDLIEIARLG